MKGTVVTQASTGTDPRLRAVTFVNDRLTAAVDRSRERHPSAADLAEYEQWASERDAVVLRLDRADGAGDSDAA